MEKTMRKTERWVLARPLVADGYDIITFEAFVICSLTLS